jgi:hypothetical protein
MERSYGILWHRTFSRRHAEALADASQAAYPDSALQPLLMS